MLAGFELLIPQTLDEASALLKEHAGSIRMFAGGTDVFVEMHTDFEAPEYLMDVKALKELSVFEKRDDGSFFAGAAVSHHTLDRDAYIRKNYTALSEGAGSVGSVQIRHRGTVGGNVCSAAPSGDTLSPLLCLGAEALIYGNGTRRTVPLNEFFTGPKRTCLKEGELLEGLILPKPWENQTSAYIKFSRRNAMDLALLGAACCIDTDGDIIRNIRIALTTSAPTPIRACEAEKYLIGKTIDEENLTQAGIIASGEAKPRTSWRCTEEYRREVIGVIVPRVIRKALGRTGKGGEC